MCLAFFPVQFSSRGAEGSCLSCSSNITAAHLYQGMLSFGAYWAEELWCEYIAVHVIIKKSVSMVFYKEKIFLVVKRINSLIVVHPASVLTLPTSVRISCVPLLTFPNCAVAFNTLIRGK